ncbi:hypothetical protein OS493_027337 [Desmophyllum pertusum]|uniref:Uncharacterized protein n=1 Tax=Desmophyllum pertusum TaxID=174260 RepID=A0A9W9YX89_9CNID|nr:hypothetical protein OS493_027337 [Desmophyllum pertusum]
MTSQTLTNWTHRDVAMNSKSRRTSTYSRRNKDKVCFADHLETVHEVPYKYDIYNKANYRFKLPEIDVHKHTPLVCRDPYAKPLKRKTGNFTDMFVSDTMKLPLIKLKATDNDAKKVASTKSKEASESLSEPHFPKANTGANSEKFQVGNTVHFKYSDFILRKMNRGSSSKDKMFIVK